MKIKFTTGLVLLIFIINPSFCHEKDPYLDRIYDEALAFLNQDVDSAIYTCKILLKESQIRDYKKGIMKSKILLGYIESNYRFNKVSALKIYLEVLSQEDFFDYPEKYFDLNLLRIYIANIFLAVEDFPNSIKFLNQNLEEARQIEDKKLIAKTLSWLFSPYDKMEDYENALRILDQSQLINNEIGDKELELSLHNSKGFILRELGRNQESKEELQKIFGLITRYGSTPNFLETKAFALTNLAETFFDIGIYDSSKFYFEQSLILKDSLGMTGGRRGKTYFYSLSGLASSSSKVDDFIVADKHFQIADNFLNTIDNSDDWMYPDFYLDYSDFLEANNKFKESSSKRKKYSELVELRDSKKEEIETIRLKEEINAVTQDYYRALEEQKTREKRAELVRLLTYFGIVVLIIVLSYRLFAKIRNSKQLQT